MDGWPEQVRQARVIQRAIGRPSKLNAMYRVLFPLSGLAPELPVPAGDQKTSACRDADAQEPPLSARPIASTMEATYNDGVPRTERERCSLQPTA